MRRVPLEALTSDMRLGKSVVNGTCTLIREGTTNLNRYIKGLKRVGIYNLYVEDETGEGIFVEDVVSDETRLECKIILQEMFQKLKTDFTIDQNKMVGVVQNLLDEIMMSKETLISLSEISTTGNGVLDHSVNSSIYAVCMGMQLGYGKSELRELAEGVLLHDIGKTVLEKHVLLKPAKLTAEEFEHIKNHSCLGYEILQKSTQISERSRQIALCHHERIDGTGYPNGLKGIEIPEFSRIAAIVDVYEALTAERCYRKALTPFNAMELLMEEATEKLDLLLTASFIQNVAIYPNGTMVQLSDGNYAVVKSQNPAMPLRPVVRVIGREKGKEVIKGEIDLMKTLNLVIVEPEINGTDMHRDFTHAV